ETANDARLRGRGRPGVEDGDRNESGRCDPGMQMVVARTIRDSLGADARTASERLSCRVMPTCVSRQGIRSPCRVVAGGAISLSCENVPECRTQSLAP